MDCWTGFATPSVTFQIKKINSENSKILQILIQMRKNHNNIMEIPKKISGPRSGPQSATHGTTKSVKEKRAKGKRAKGQRATTAQPRQHGTRYSGCGCPRCSNCG